MNINLHIESVVLHGLDTLPGQQHLLQAAIQSELMRLLTSKGLPGVRNSRGGAIASLNGKAIRVTRGDQASQLGRQIAQAVYSGLRI